MNRLAVLSGSLFIEALSLYCLIGFAQFCRERWRDRSEGLELVSVKILIFLGFVNLFNLRLIFFYLFGIWLLAIFHLFFLFLLRGFVLSLLLVLCFRMFHSSHYYVVVWLLLTRNLRGEARAAAVGVH